MRTFVFVTVLLAFWVHPPLAAQELKSEFLFDMEATLKAPQVVGPVLTGTRVILLVSEGSVKSNKLTGTLLPGSGDWGLIVDSTTFKVDARATIKTDDGALIYMTYSGVIHAEAKQFAMLLGGRSNEVPASDYYFRTNPVFETSAPKYAWLNHTLAIGVGRMPSPGKITYRIYAIK